VPRRCTVCMHPNRHEIDVAIARGDSYAMIANRFGISWQSVRRHAITHLTKTVQDAVRAEAALSVQNAIRTDVIEPGARILSQVRELNQRARQLLDEAAAHRRYTGAAAFLKEARELLTLEARLLGELDTRDRVEVHNYLDARTLAVRIARELEDEPELAERVGRVLMELMDGGR
jgi:hypothetical protein